MDNCWQVFNKTLILGHQTDTRTELIKFKYKLKAVRCKIINGGREVYHHRHQTISLEVCTTKEEVYRVLATSGEIYLPPVQQTNWDFIIDILSRDKLVGYSFDFEVYSLRQSENYWSPTYWGITHPKNIGLCKETLKIRPIVAWIRLRKVSFEKMDLKYW